jgi:hypothetical protein
MKKHVLFVLMWLGSAQAGIIPVTNTLDTGDGSLHGAIELAESHVGPDTIVFNLTQQDPGWDRNKGAWRIAIVTQLPEFLDGGTFIDGSSQTRFGGNTNSQGPEIYIYGAAAPFEVPGFIIRSAFNKFYDLSIGAFPSYIFRLYGSASHHNVFQGLYLNLDATGRYPYRMVKSEGIRMTQGPHHNLIGGVLPAERNIMSGFYGRAIYIEQSHYNIIKNNYIGVKKNGIDPAGNGWTSEWATYPTRHRPDAFEGILVTDGSRGNVFGGLEPGSGNVIAANLRAGLRLESTGTDSNYVQGNYIGVAADGETGLGNGEAGLWIAGDPAGNGFGPGPAYNVVEKNVISANLSSGVQMRWGSRYNRIVNNIIGANASASKPLPNSHNGIYFFGRSDKGYPLFNQVGPGNIILADGIDTANDPWAAVRLDDPGTSHNNIFANYLCCAPNGLLNSANNSGVYISKGSHHNIIGPDNVISGKRYGVWIRHDSTVCNTITANRIINMSEQAIYLDSGANENLAAPQIVSATETGIQGMTIARGWLEIFSGPAGQLLQYLGQVQADAQGRFQWVGVISDLATATVRDSSGNTSMTATSQVTPVELMLFTYQQLSNGRLRLLWQTATESNNLGFYVEKRGAASVYQTLAFVPGHGTSLDRSDYSWDDKEATTGDAMVYYRLRQTDLDGRTQFSPELAIAPVLPHTLQLYPAFPNPFNEQTRLSFSVPERMYCSLRVYDVLGRCVVQLCNGMLNAGSHAMNWQARNAEGQALAGGVYWMVLTGGDSRQVHKILLLR